MSGGSGPKVVLIGGPLTADDGSHLDSRQPIVGDDASEVMRRSLATSWLWWTVAVSLALPILETAGPGAYALVIGDRSVVDVRPDGSAKRTSLRGLLAGGVGAVCIERTGMRNDALREGFDEVRTLRAWNGQSLGKIGVQRVGPADARWRFLDGNEYYLTDAGPHIAPTVIVDTSDFLTAQITLPQESAFSDVPPDSYAEARFQGLEQRRLFGDVVLVMPHTHRAEVVLRDYAEWVRSGRSSASPHSIPVSHTLWDPAAPPSPYRYTRPVPIDAAFEVTGLIDGGEWRSPDDLEAARSLLDARFDLKIGIWDLVRNPLLRRTLLEATPAVPAPVAIAPVPPAAARRANDVVAGKMAQRTQEAEALAAIREQAQPLFTVGWEVEKLGLLRLPLTEAVRRWSLEEEPMPMVYLSLMITKRSTYVLARTTMYNQVDLPTYAVARKRAFEEAAEMELPEIDKMWPVIWRGPGGWGDDVDWAARFQDLTRRTAQWVLLFAELVAACRLALATRF